jgi:glycosyltransferase involved in cell wall biosynthesis
MDIYVDNSGLRSKIARAAYLTTCTAANEKHLFDAGIATPGKLHKLYHGIEMPDSAPPVPPRNLPFTFLAVGRLVPKKGYGFLLEACALLQSKGLDFQCLIVGKGPLEAELKAQIEAAGLQEKVILQGYLPPNRMPEAYTRSQVLVVPSVVGGDGDVDGLPNVCLEAMMHGLPVIGSHVSGIPEGVTDGENGWLVPPSNAEKLAGTMQQALFSPDLSPMRAAAFRKVQEHFNLQKNISELRAIMERHKLGAGES